MTIVKMTCSDSGTELSAVVSNSQVQLGTKKWTLSIPWDITTAKKTAQKGDSDE
jgi:hypothetical protein